jgi:hypothetical protein
LVLAALAGAALVWVSSALAVTTAANRLNAQSKLSVFMEAQSSTLACKSHARNKIILGATGRVPPAWNL